MLGCVRDMSRLADRNVTVIQSSTRVQSEKEMSDEKKMVELAVGCGRKTEKSLPSGYLT